ncbi:hypothetical protein STEG23_015575 [Scotinomys teguina]
MEVVAAAPRFQLLLIVLMAAMLLPRMKSSTLLVRRKIARTIKLQGSIGKEQLTSGSLTHPTGSTANFLPRVQLLIELQSFIFELYESFECSQSLEP